jgi:hypothetical protein
MRLPTATEINPIPEDLDGQHAVRNFLGKTLDEAEALFRESSITYQEDLMFMGAPAFRFYVQAAINYIQSEAATGDPDIINCFQDILRHRLEFEPKELAAVAPQLASVCRYILEHYDRFDLRPDIYGNLRPLFQSLEQAFLRQIHT